MIVKILQFYKKEFLNKRFLISFLQAFALIVISLTINFYAGTYATNNASNPVADIILDNLPVYNVDWLFVYGPFIFWVVSVLSCFLWPKKLPFILKQIALLVVVRSFFITLTHIAPFPMRLHISPDAPTQGFTFGGDLFFSGHTSFPFLWALMFWEDRPLRIFFTVCAVFFGTIVLLAHLHYSIDVFAAFFMAHSVYHIGTKLFKKDHQLFKENGQGLTLFLKTLK